MKTSFLLLLSLFSVLLISLIFWNRKRIIKQAKKSFIKKALKKEPTDEEKEDSANSSSKVKANKKIVKEPKVEYSLNEIRNGIKRVEILLDHKETEEAEKILISILSVDTKNIEAHLLLSSLYLQKKQYSRAEVLYRTLIELEKFKNTSSLSNLAFCLFEQNKIDESIYYYEYALKKDPQNFKRCTNLGQVMFVVKNFDEAIKLFKKANKLKPRDTEILFMLADTYREAGKFKEARESYKKILDYEPYNAEAKEEIIKLEESNN